jgi:dienelactone hydrolase
MTLSTEQFLKGEKRGKAVILAGELRIPKLGPERLPTVILMESSGGIGAAEEDWAQALNAIGIATFTLDSFSARKLYNTTEDQSQLSYETMIVDAYRALSVLAEHPRVDPRHVAIMGFSRGAVAAVYSSMERFRKMYGSPKLQFDAHVGLYTPCEVVYRDEDRTTGRPIRLFHGTADDYDPIAPCRSYVSRLKAAGADISLTEYPGVEHAYDLSALGRRIQAPLAQTTRNCTLEENDNGQVINARTGKVFTFDDTCVQVGPHLGYDAAAYQATSKAVQDFLTQVFDRP